MECPSIGSVLRILSYPDLSSGLSACQPEQGPSEIRNSLWIEGSPENLNPPPFEKQSPWPGSDRLSRCVINDHLLCV